MTNVTDKTVVTGETAVTVVTASTVETAMTGVMPETVNDGCDNIRSSILLPSHG